MIEIIIRAENEGDARNFILLFERVATEAAEVGCHEYAAKLNGYAKQVRNQIVTALQRNRRS